MTNEFMLMSTELSVSGHIKEFVRENEFLFLFLVVCLLFDTF